MRDRAAKSSRSLRHFLGRARTWLRHEIVEPAPPDLIVLRHEAMPDFGLPLEALTRVEGHDHGVKTRTTLVGGPYDEVRGNAEAGWFGAFDTLTRLL